MKTHKVYTHYNEVHNADLLRQSELICCVVCSVLSEGKERRP